MLCQLCGKNPATTHIKTIRNGTLTEYNLCSVCAHERGLVKDLSFDFGSLLGGLMGSSPARSTTLRCPKCGVSFAEISESGKIGCAECYKVFLKQLLPTIQRIHGTTQHKGKVPGTSALRIVDPAGAMAVVQQPSPLEEKRAALQSAIQAQNFEQAAVLRDEIRALEKEGGR